LLSLTQLKDLSDYTDVTGIVDCLLQKRNLQMSAERFKKHNRRPTWKQNCCRVQPAVRYSCQILA